MKVKVKVYGPLPKYLGGLNEVDIELEKVSRVSEIIDILDLPRSLITFVSVNDIKKEFEYMIEENITLKIFPRVMGG